MEDHVFDFVGQRKNADISIRQTEFERGIPVSGCLLLRAS
jgi:hypothetical protein